MWRLEISSRHFAWVVEDDLHENACSALRNGVANYGFRRRSKHLRARKQLKINTPYGIYCAACLHLFTEVYEIISRHS